MVYLSCAANARSCCGYFGLVEDAESWVSLCLCREAVLHSEPVVTVARLGSAGIREALKIAGKPVKIEVLRETEADPTGEDSVSRVLGQPLLFDPVFHFGYAALG